MTIGNLNEVGGLAYGHHHLLQVAGALSSGRNLGWDGATGKFPTTPSSLFSLSFIFKGFQIPIRWVLAVDGGLLSDPHS
ncbi:hypothetical protein CDL15_Pgr006745 [Punica granatum]|uniref:Uncharacterized protein n=1 Tax=Punica granatum TaxID=22663 RepID=A0A218X659_PUNGR|nr:hypothetical protein CDL15_Pgr006745 [Punica granatum]